MSELSKTVIRTLNIFELLVDSDEPLSLDEITRLIGANKTSIFRGLKTLEHKGYVRQKEDSSEYYPSLKLTTMARKIISRMDFRSIVIPYMKQLVEETNLSVHLSVREEDEVVFIEKMDPYNELKLSFDLGKRSPIYCTSVGKVFMAYMSDNERQELLNNLTLTKHTQNTIVDKETLLKEIKITRQRGYAIDNEEHNSGIMCVGAPIKRYKGKVENAISIIGLTNQVKDKGIDNLGEIIKNKAAEISKELGY